MLPGIAFIPHEQTLKFETHPVVCVYLVVRFGCRALGPPIGSLYAPGVPSFEKLQQYAQFGADLFRFTRFAVSLHAGGSTHKWDEMTSDAAISIGITWVQSCCMV